MRVANFYFLVIGIMTCIPAISPVTSGGRYGTIAALAFVVTVSMIKEAYEDFQRYRSDRDLNSSKVEVLRDGNFVEVTWEKVVVGDICRVKADKYFPADLVMLSASGPSGTCYIETANLDGETNLKIKTSVADTVTFMDAASLSTVQGSVACEGPNPRLYTFSGSITLANTNQTVPIGPETILLRGSQLRNTEVVYGVAIYTGRDCRIMRNASKKKQKRSQVESTVNKQLYLLFALMLGLAAFCTVAGHIWKINKGQYMWNLDITVDSTTSGLSFLTFCILYSSIVPISLYVSLELVKVCQCAFINWDVHMYDPESDTPARARTSNINEELGQIHYVFSDKTGTLTRNVMEFRQCSVGGVSYGEGSTGSTNLSVSTLDLYSLNGQSLGQKSQVSVATTSIPVGSSKKPPKRDLNFPDKDRFLADLKCGAPNAPQILEFLRMLAICHTVVPEKDKENPSAPLIYQASSPDEEALVKAGRGLGFEFQVRTPDAILITAGGVQEKYDVLNIIEFNSTRKRMSVVYRTPSGQVKLYCKGADTVIFARLKPNDPLVQITKSHLETFAADGLRTLCFAERTLEPALYAAWNKKFVEASCSLVDKDKLLDECAEEIEQELTLIGASAIEDRLQDGVSDTLKSLATAGIKIWVLTGDKQETAINIGFSCGLLEHDMHLILLNQERKEDAASDLEKAIVEYVPVPDNERLALVIDGATLSFVLEPDLKHRFMDLGRHCTTVICCRVSPLQKALIVKLVKETEKKVTLAIGDGANDVSMIQAAHVGIGISGKEGMQAVLASDFAIAQFRFLKRLLLVHGRWSYKRITKLILYSIYKNVNLTFTFFWFSIISGFSGQSPYDGWVYSMYNVIFTSLPPVVVATQDRDYSAKAGLAYPQLYSPGQISTGFNFKVFWGWVVAAVVHSTVVYFLTTAMVTPALDDGQLEGFWASGLCVYSVLIVVVLLKLAIATSTWTWINHFAMWGSMVVYLAFLAVYSSPPFMSFAPDMFWVTYYIYKEPTVWMTIFIVPCVALTPDFIWKYIKQNFMKSEKLIIQEQLARARKLRPVPLAGLGGLGRPIVRLFRADSSFTTHTGFAFAQERMHVPDLISRKPSMASSDLVPIGVMPSDPLSPPGITSRATTHVVPPPPKQSSPPPCTSAPVTPRNGAPSHSGVMSSPSLLTRLASKISRSMPATDPGSPPDPDPNVVF